MKRYLIITSVLLLLCPVVQAQKSYLLSASDPAGYIARLLVNEVPFPGEHGYVSEEDTKATMRALLLVLDSRIHRIPPGYRRSEVAYVDSSDVIDVITAGGVRGQMDGFYRANGRPAMAARVTERVNNLTKIANTGTPGRFARLLHYAQALATQYLAGSVPADIFQGITVIPPQRVTGRAYGWMTDQDCYHPGGCFVKIPDSMKGRLGGNRFFTLKVRKSSSSAQPKSKGRSVVVMPE